MEARLSIILSDFGNELKFEFLFVFFAGEREGSLLTVCHRELHSLLQKEAEG
jgi:hypothetical protein